MSREKKQQKLFKEFIDYQLKPHNLTYDNVKGDPQWYMKYSTTQDKENEFKDYIVKRCRDVLRLSKKDAENLANIKAKDDNIDIDKSINLLNDISKYDNAQSAVRPE